MEFDMNNKNIIFGIILIVFALGCGVPQSEYDKLKAEHESLKTELDECKNGAERIIASVEKAYNEKKYTLAKQKIELLYSKHPESSKNAEFKNLFKTIERKEVEEIKRKEAEEKERVRLANLNNTGIWEVSYYVNDFGAPTQEAYITTDKFIEGTFSNTAVQDRKLNVRILITAASFIAIKLYEYAGNNPVKASRPDSYTVLLQDNDGVRTELKAVNTSERLKFNKQASKQIHNAFLKGGTVKFRITHDDRQTNQYKFDIQKSNYYENAYRELLENNKS